MNTGFLVSLKQGTRKLPGEVVRNRANSSPGECEHCCVPDPIGRPGPGE